jgi:hypothetical protein
VTHVLRSEGEVRAEINNIGKEPLVHGERRNSRVVSCARLSQASSDQVSAATPPASEEQQGAVLDPQPDPTGAQLIFVGKCQHGVPPGP